MNIRQILERLLIGLSVAGSFGLVIWALILLSERVP